MAEEMHRVPKVRHRPDELVGHKVPSRLYKVAEARPSWLREAQKAETRPTPFDFFSGAMPDFKDPNWTSEIHKAVMEWITEFEMNLDPQHEVGAQLVNFGQAVTFYLERIDYCSSPLMRFTGSTEDGQPVQLIQHVSQISIMLVRLPLQNPNEPKRRIGFYAEAEPPKNAK